MKQRDVLIAAASCQQYATADTVAVVAECSPSVARKWLAWATANDLFRGIGERPRFWLAHPPLVGEYLAPTEPATGEQMFAKLDDVELHHWLMHAESIATGLIEWGTYPPTNADRWLKRWEMGRDEMIRRSTARPGTTIEVRR